MFPALYRESERTTVRVLIAGGGTGGHVYIGIALARELMRREPDSDVLFVGTRRGLESRIVPSEGFRLEFIVSAGLKGMNIVNLVRNSALIPGSLLQARRVVREFQPGVVVGVGGYSSGPVVASGWWLGKPTLIIEPNAYPGLTNRWLGRVVNRIALALPDQGGYFGGKGVVTGIPVRGEFREVPRRLNRSPFTLLIYGGSQGSHALNRIVCDALTDLKQLAGSLSLIHQTGEKEYELVRNAYDAAGVKGDLHAFLPRIYDQFACADLILSRAGAGTVAELTVAGKASILVPFPGAADDHQRKNAEALESYGAARMIPEQEWTSGRLLKEVCRFIDNPGELESMESSARRLARPDAATRIADLVLELGQSCGAVHPRV
jgi:UDP-N-acetylglucosamine--N-acetylmuramyl-(pentapeptide) pyrophosphoryl-undecaprenol N-acetylglucosamine transferase